MITYLDTATGQRHIPYGVGSSVDVKADGTVTHLFIRGKGWTKVKKNQFRMEEIPDLPTYPSTEPGSVARNPKDDEYKAYAEKYGAECAMHFLWCCDASKPRWHAEIINPDPNKPGPVTQLKFRTLFGADLFQFADTLMFLMHRWLFDLLKFQGWCMKSFTDYAEFKDSKGGSASLEDYVKFKWGDEAAAFIEDLIDDKPRP